MDIVTVKVLPSDGVLLTVMFSLFYLKFSPSILVFNELYYGIHVINVRNSF